MYYSHWFIQLCVPDLRHINFLMQKSCLLSIPSDTSWTGSIICIRLSSQSLGVFWCCGNHCWFFFVLCHGYCFFCIEPFGDRTRPQHHETTPKLNCFSLQDALIKKPPCYHHRLNQLVLELMVLGFIAV